YYKGPIFSPARLIVTCHDLHFLDLDSIAPGELLKRYYCRTILKHANTIIAVSEYSKQTIENFLGNKSSRIEVVFDSVSDKFKPMDKKASLDELKQSFNLNPDFILYVGNLKPHKNLDGLIEAYGLLPSSLKQAHQLVIAGKKDENFLRLWKFIKSKSLENNVVFLDLVNDEDLICLYNASSFLALVSFCEGFGLPALEAMACGIPVLVSNTTSLPEIVADMGLQADPHNSQEIAHYMEKLLTDESLRQMLSAKGLIRAKNFTIADMAEKILKIFKQNYKYLF
ncbi:MAG: glycosyltransferase family 4 protein, partial [Candidatus Omnitrophica bacterium]|nr:glycosyltransferase family 4 protein [Candidatus Omnitrophota bacterium]